jgi:hypothetical protein
MTTSEAISDAAWDYYDQPNHAANTHSKPSVQQIRHFTNVDGIKSGFVKRSEHVRHLQHHIGDLNITIQSPLGDETIIPYEANEESVLPPSFLLAAHNRLSYESVLSAQRSVKYALPFFFYGAQMFPAIVLGTTKMTESLNDIAHTMTPAVVHGFHRLALHGHAWPAAIHSANPADAIIGMLAFSIPDAALGMLDAFQGGSSELCLVRASFVLKDGSSCSIDCRMYVYKNQEDPMLVPQDKRKWRTSDLMQDEWHLRNLAPWNAQEEQLRIALSGRQ